MDPTTFPEVKDLLRVFQRKKFYWKSNNSMLSGRGKQKRVVKESVYAEE
jgi:hypothetical protein